MSSTGRDDDTLAPLIRWLEDGGARLPRVVLRARDDGRGAFASAPIAVGEDVLFVPRARLITREVAQRSPMCRWMREAGLAPHSAHTWLALFLLEERRDPRSPWRPYLDALPASFEHMPLAYGPHMRALLEGTCALERIAVQHRALAAEYDHLQGRVPGFERFGPDDLTWARLAVLTRVFGIVVDGERTEALVPLADMLDHARPRETAWGYDGAAGGFVVTAEVDFRAGDELHDSYGRKCNGRFLVNYGFCLSDNDENEAWLEIATSRRVATGTTKPGVRRFAVPARYRTRRTRTLFAFLRARLATDAERPALLATYRRTGAMAAVSARHERALLATIAAAAEAALARYPTRLDSDVALLGTPELPRAIRDCLVLRIGEKRVLHAWIALAADAIPILRSPPDELAHALRRRGAPGTLLDDYLTHVAASLAPRAG